MHFFCMSKTIRNCFSILLCVSALSACGPRASSIRGNTEGYDLEHPEILLLPTALNEISGLYFYEKDTSLFAIVDEDGFLYKIFPKHPEQILRWKFAGPGDYEDLVLVGGIFYILRSDGALFAADIATGGNVKSTLYEAPEKGNEFESIYYDEQRGMLMLVCKDCDRDNKQTITSYGFSLATKQYQPATLVMDANHIAGIVGQNKIKFKPSAGTLNPFTNQVMLVSAINSLLVVADKNGGVLQAYPLPAALYKQPEGIAVGSDRTLYISNEWAKKGTANILVMPYRPQK